MKYKVGPFDKSNDKSHMNCKIISKNYEEEDDEDEEDEVKKRKQLPSTQIFRLAKLNETQSGVAFDNENYQNETADPKTSPALPQQQDESKQQQESKQQEGQQMNEPQQQDTNSSCESGFGTNDDDLVDQVKAKESDAPNMNYHRCGASGRRHASNTDEDDEDDYVVDEDEECETSSAKRDPSPPPPPPPPTVSVPAQEQIDASISSVRVNTINETWRANMPLSPTRLEQLNPPDQILPSSSQPPPPQQQQQQQQQGANDLKSSSNYTQQQQQPKRSSIYDLNHNNNNSDDIDNILNDNSSINSSSSSSASQYRNCFQRFIDALTRFYYSCFCCYSTTSHTSHTPFIWSWLSIFCCCCPLLGGISLYLTHRSKKLKLKQKYELAEKYSNYAEKLNIASLIVGIIFYAIAFFIIKHVILIYWKHTKKILYRV